MAYSHGKHTEIEVAGGDISVWCKTSEFTRNADKHELDGYGVDDKIVQGGKRGGEFVCGGAYDTTEDGPAAIIDPLVGTELPITILRRTEGTGVGKPLQTFSATVDEYKESNPHNDYVMWSAKFTVSGPVVKTVQT